MEKDRLIRLLSAIRRAPRQLPHKPFIPFGVQGYVIEDERPAQGVCGRDTALQERRAAAVKAKRAEKRAAVKKASVKAAKTVAKKVGETAAKASKATKKATAKKAK